MILSAVALMTPTVAQHVLSEAPNSPERQQRIQEFVQKAKQLSDRFEAHVYKNAVGETMPYRLFRPTDIAGGRGYPLVVYLHGVGGVGTDNGKQLQAGNLFGSHVWALPENQAKQATFVVAPQTDSRWAPQRGQTIPVGGVTTSARLAFEVIDKLKAELPVDSRRIYVIGNSLGGAGVWYVIGKRPGLFAAAVPMCGFGDPETAPAYKDVPVWAFHGDADDTVPVTLTRVMVEAARKTGGKPLYTEYQGVKHNVAEWAVTEPALVDWVFAQKR